MLQTSVVQIVFHNIHQCCHLTEQQALVIGLFQLRQNAIEKFKLARCTIYVGPEELKSLNVNTFGTIGYHARNFRT